MNSGLENAAFAGPPPAPPLPHFFWSLLIACGLCAASLGSYPAPWLFRDRSPVDDSDLLPAPRAEIPDEENAYLLLREVEDRLAGERTAGPRTFEEAEALLNRNLGERNTSEETRQEREERQAREARKREDSLLQRGIPELDDIDAALARPGFEFPWPEDDDHRSQALDRIPGFLNLHARDRLAAGDVRAAMASAERLVRIGERSGACSRTIFDWHQAQWARQVGLLSIQRIVRSPEVLEEHLMSCDRELAHVGRRAYTEACEVVREHFRWNRSMILEIVDREGAVAEIKVFSLRDTLALFAEQTRTQLRLLSGGAPVPRSSFEKRRDSWSTVENALTWNGAGRIVAATGAAILANADLPGRIRGFECDLAATRLMIALRRFERARGRRPETLAELVPEFLAELPRDPFGEEPMRYDRAKGIIYSVGTDGIDEGGAPEPGRSVEPTYFLDGEE